MNTQTLCKLFTSTLSALPMAAQAPQNKSDIAEGTPTTLPAEAYQNRYSAITQGLVLPLALGDFAAPGLLDTYRKVATIPELALRRKYNIPIIEPEPLAKLKADFCAQLLTRQDLVGPARQIIAASIVGRGDPMEVTAQTVVDIVRPLSAREIVTLFDIIVVNPFLAELWNSVATSVPMIKDAPIEPPAEPLVVKLWTLVSGFAGDTLWPINRQIDHRIDAFGALTERRSISTIGWGQGEAERLVEVHGDILSEFDRVAHSLVGVDNAPQALATVVALGAICGSPVAWNGYASEPCALHRSANELAWALSLNRLDMPSRKRVALEVLVESRRLLRLAFSTVSEFAATPPQGRKAKLDQMADQLVYLSSQAEKRIQHEIALLHAGNVDGRTIQLIDSQLSLAENLLEAPSHYTGEELLELWRKRASERAFANLTLAECWPKGLSAGATQYGLRTLSPLTHPGLFGDWAGLSAEVGAINIPLFAFSVKQIDEILSDLEPESHAKLCADLYAVAEGAESYVNRLTTTGVRNLAIEQQVAVSAFVRELLAEIGEGGGSLRQSNWAIDPTRLTTPVKASGKPDEVALSPLARLRSRILTDGDPLNSRLKIIEGYKVAAIRITEAFDSGEPAYQNLRRRLECGGSHTGSYFVSQGEVIELLDRMQFNGYFAADALFNFLDQSVRNAEALGSLVEGCKGQGAVSLALRKAKSRLARHMSTPNAAPVGDGEKGTADKR